MNCGTPLNQSHNQASDGSMYDLWNAARSIKRTKQSGSSSHNCAVTAIPHKVSNFLLLKGAAPINLSVPGLHKSHQIS